MTVLAIAKPEAYAVRMAWRGLPTRLVPLEFADEAANLFCALRDDGNYGASDMMPGCGDLFDAAGAIIGHVSYNGKIWIGVAEPKKAAIA